MIYREKTLNIGYFETLVHKAERYYRKLEEKGEKGKIKHNKVLIKVCADLYTMKSNDKYWKHYVNICCL